jgi:GGDEF domain-containing protein
MMVSRRFANAADHAWRNAALSTQAGVVPEWLRGRSALSGKDRRMKMSQIAAREPAPLATAPGTGWLAVAAMLTDLAFETDAMGRFTAFGPGKVLGRSAALLLGLEVANLLDGAATDLSAAQFRSVITTICMECVAWHGRVRLTDPGGGSGFYRLSLAPRLSGGNVVGTYGMLFDLETPELTLPDSHAGRADDPALRHNTMLDAETGLWSARTFTEEMARRFDRLDVEELPGTLIYLSFARAPAALQSAIAMRLADELRDIVRPTDLLGRMDNTTIGLWCDGMDHLTGGERAAKFCTQLPELLPERPAITVGVSPRWAGSLEDTGSVLEHAAIALRLAELATESAPDPAHMGAWRVWQRD